MQCVTLKLLQPFFIARYPELLLNDAFAFHFIIRMSVKLVQVSLLAAPFLHVACIWSLDVITLISDVLCD